MSDNNAAGWQPDPTGKHDHRYWDGSQWTDNVADAGVAGTDPYDAAPEPEAVAPEEVAPEPEAMAPEPEPIAPVEPTVVTPVAAGDTTASWPAATPPAAPPPYVPPSPVGGDGTGGSSKRGLVIGGAILAAVALAVVAFLALGGDDEDDVRAQLTSAIQNDEDLDVSDDQAECIADLVVDAAGEDAFDDTDFDAEDPPPEFVAAVLEVGPERLVEECGLDEETAFGSDGTTDSSDSTDDGSTDDSSTDGGDDQLEELRDQCADGDFVACDDLYFSADLGSDLEEFGSTCGGIAVEPQGGFCEESNGGENPVTDGVTDGLSDGDIEDIIADAYEQSLGLDRDQAECLAGKIADAIDSGELSQEQAMTEVFDYLEDCDISLEEISGN